MSFDVKWDVDKYREEHECEEHWMLRKAFIEKWKNNYPEERLICLARVFSNIEFMGCRYPPEVMKEVAALSVEVANSYRNQKKTKLQRTFVSASDAAEDRARGIKRLGGVIVDIPQVKTNRISFVKQGDTSSSVTNTTEVKSNWSNFTTETPELNSDRINFTTETPELKLDCINFSTETPEVNSERINFVKQGETVMNVDENIPNDVADPVDVAKALSESQEKPKYITVSKSIFDLKQYMDDLLTMICIDVKCFRDSMFNTPFGRMVLLIRPWISRLDNITASCHACHINLENTYKNKIYSIKIKGKVLAEAHGDSKAEARSNSEMVAWNTLRTQVVSVLIKEQWIAHNDARVTVSDVSGRTQRQDDSFGTPIEGGVASKMMKMMGWKGGGLGVDSQGIAEPIKPHLQMVNRAGLGSCTSDIRHLKLLAGTMMRRYIRSASIDVDLVFSSDFTKEERAALHQVAQKAGLASKSYGSDSDRFLVVKKKLNPFAIVKAAIEEGGNTAKYQVFIPAAININGRYG